MMSVVVITDQEMINMHIQTFQQELDFVPPKACMGNIALVQYAGVLHQVVVMKALFNVENNLWRYYGSPTIVPATINVYFDKEPDWSDKKGIMQKAISTLLEDQLIVFSDNDVKAIVQSSSH